MNTAAVLAWLQAMADLGLKAVEIATRYHTAEIDDATLHREWQGMRLDQAQAERLWHEAAGESSQA